MKTYLVGGWVRDYFRGYPCQDRDWVVVGSTTQEMIKLGFKSIGTSFPVFLHPLTQEEYALARVEKKIAKGYHGFSVHADPSVTLEEDLSRRDLTINAMAFDPITKEIFDPFGGRNDWNDGWLRHVSPAFSDDPLRLVRLARFYAVFDQMHIYPQTISLCQEIVQNHEIEALVPERVRLEVQKMYNTAASPHRFWQALELFGALKLLFPALHGKNFSKDIIPSERDKKDPFIVGLLRLRLLMNNMTSFESLAEKLKCSRHEQVFFNTEEILSQTESNPHSVVELIMKTRSLHNHDILQQIHQWAVRNYISWSIIERSLEIMKKASVPDLQTLEPVLRRNTLLNFYSDLIDRSVPF
jgi:tRNA nucleotidyltransferase/poly(A) polymerase